MKPLTIALPVLAAILIAHRPALADNPAQAPAAGAAENTSTTPSGADPDWPMFIGPDGSRVPTVQGYSLVDDLGAMRQAWKLQHHTGVGKGLYPGTLRKCRELGIEPFYGGAANLIIVDDIIYCSYYKPDGKNPAKPVGWRTVDDPASLLPEWFFSVTADDILLAVNAQTGQILWQAVEKGGGLNRLAHKRAHWVRSPAYADGRVFSMGSMGVLRAYNAKSGQRLWEAATNPDLERARAEHIKNKQLYWGAEDQSSLVIAEGVVIVARETLSGYSAETGQRLWHIGDRVMSKHATPTLWTHDGRTYVLAHTPTSGQLRLIDPRNGSVIWTHTGLGPRLGTLSVNGDIVITAFASEKGPQDRDGLARQVRYGALRLSLQGATQLWVMPDEPQNRFHWKHDKGARYRTSIRDGLLYLVIAPDDRPKGAPRARLLVINPLNGQIIATRPVDESIGNPIPMEDKLFVVHDYAHSNPISQSYWTAGRSPRQLNGIVDMPHDSITGYYIDLEPIYYKGRLYFRTLEGIICYDLRQPMTPDSAALQLNLPDALTGSSRDKTITLYLDGSSVTHGNTTGSSRLHDVDVSRLRFDGSTLDGDIGLGVHDGTRNEYYHVDATIADGALRGTISVIEQPFAKPLRVAGSVTAMQHQPAWMPPATHTIVLNDAARNIEGQPGRLILLPTIRGDSIIHVAAWADHTTRTPPAVYYDQLKVEDGKLKGAVWVRYRPDQWTTPLVEHDDTAVARYDINVDLTTSDQQTIGQYTGQYGVALRRSQPLVGTVMHPSTFAE